MAMRKFKKIEENIKNNVGKPMQPLYFETFIGDEKSYETIEIFMIGYNKIVTRPIRAIRRNSIPPYEITVVIRGIFEIEDEPEKLEYFIRKEYLKILPESFHENLEVKVTVDLNPITIKIRL